MKRRKNTFSAERDFSYVPSRHLKQLRHVLSPNLPIPFIKTSHGAKPANLRQLQAGRCKWLHGISAVGDGTARITGGRTFKGPNAANHISTHEVRDNWVLYCLYNNPNRKARGVWAQIQAVRRFCLREITWGLE